MRKQRICAAILATVLCGVMLSTDLVAAAACLPDEPTASTNAIKEPDSPQREEFAWYFRERNGVLQRRLWSLTRGVWVTEWEDSPYA